MNDPTAKQFELPRDKAFEKYWLELQAMDETARCVRFFDRGTWLSVHGDDALLLCNEFYQTKRALRGAGGTAAPTASLSNNASLSSAQNNAACYLPLRVGPEFVRALAWLLRDKRVRVALLEKSSGSGSGSGSGLHSQWSVKKRASPGNVAAFEAELAADGGGGGGGSDASVMVAIDARAQAGGSSFDVGVAFIDTTNKILGFSQFVDTSALANTESVLVQIAAKEVCLPIDAVTAKALGLTQTNNNNNNNNNTDNNNTNNNNNNNNNNNFVPTSEEAEKTGNFVNSRLLEVLSRCVLPLTKKRRVDFKVDSVEQDLSRLLQHSAIELKKFNSKFSEFKLALGAMGCLFSHLELCNDADNFNSFSLQLFDMNQYMRIDRAALIALNVLPERGTNNTNDGSGNFNLLSFLNKCKTSMGEKLLSQWIRQPLMNANMIRQRQDLVSAFVSDSLTRVSLRNSIRLSPNVHALCRKLQSSKASLQTLCVLYQFAVMIKPLIDSLNNHESEFKDTVRRVFIDRFDSVDKDLENYKRLIEAAVDLQRIKDHEFVIQSSYTPTLTEISEKKQKYFNMIQLVPVAVAAQLGISDKKLKLEQSDRHGYFLRLTRTDEKSIRSKMSGEFAPFETSKKGVLFRGRHLTLLNEKWRKYSAAYVAAQAEIVERVIKVAVTYLRVFNRAADMIARLDVMLSWAHVAAETGKSYIRPTIIDTNNNNNNNNENNNNNNNNNNENNNNNNNNVQQLWLKRARHPCLEVLDGIQFIPNDTLFKRGESEFHIITGPNMGGKSTYIRTVALIVLMSQLGCFVPCDEAIIPITDCILARVGAGDSQLRGISTFMAEMLETANILSTATERSLVIIDELGRGTSTYDGFGLAWAISEEIIRKIKAFTFFATHFHEMTALSKHEKTAKNYHVKAITTGGRLAMLYKIEEGSSDQSLGIHVAKLANFPADVCRAAKRKAEEMEEFGNFTQEMDLSSGLSSGLGKNNNNNGNSAEIDEKAAGIEQLRHWWNESRNISDFNSEQAKAHLSKLEQSENSLIKKLFESTK